ncbi:MAG: fatty acid hydroxylase [Bacteroidetes bacterium]|nr:hypothetical protein AWN76_009630 [Rhodothermaceae bacterium RA]RMH67081.1 MAG: fatty acid hydroxylase [Bacteroidota bacterium]
MHRIPEPKDDQTGTIFNHPALEVLTKAPPQVPVITYLAVIVGLAYVGYQRQVVDSFLVAAAIFVAALFAWTFFEYVFHRYINHLDHYFPNSKLACRIAYTLHGIHHEFPRDRDRLIMPPVPGLLIISILFGLFWLIMGSYVFVFLPGFLTGYLLYVLVHYSTHKFKPPKRLKFLWRHHALHHYKYPHRAFGVSTTLWDHVFGTMPPKQHRNSEHHAGQGA